LIFASSVLIIGSSLHLNVRTNYIKESYNSCKAAFSATRSQWKMCEKFRKIIMTLELHSTILWCNINRHVNQTT